MNPADWISPLSMYNETCVINAQGHLECGNGTMGPFIDSLEHFYNPANDVLLGTILEKIEALLTKEKTKENKVNPNMANKVNPNMANNKQQQQYNDLPKEAPKKCEVDEQSISNILNKIDMRLA
jgi:hypothetical protein